jgi:hypothetical protein
MAATVHENEGTSGGGWRGSLATAGERGNADAEGGGWGERRGRRGEERRGERGPMGSVSSTRSARKSWKKGWSWIFERILRESGIEVRLSIGRALVVCLVSGVGWLVSAVRCL